MSEPQVIATHKCVHTHVPVGPDMCQQLTRVVSKNHDGCCRGKCKSPWRMCRQCILLPEKDRGNGPVDSETGLCEMHGGAIIVEEEIPLEQISIGGEVLMIPVCDIAPLPDQPRKHFDEDRLRALAESIKHRGQVQPGLVVEIENSQWKYELRDGERRLRACKIANVDFRATVQTSKDKGRNESLLTSAVANFNREGHTPWEEIDLVRRLLLPCPDTGVTFTQAQVAESLGHSNSVWVSQRKVVGERLCESALEHIAEHPSIPFSVIKQVADLPDEKQVQAFLDYQNGKTNARRLTMAAANFRRATGRSRKKHPSEYWNEAKNMVATLDERTQRVASTFSSENISGDLNQYAVERGSDVAEDLERIASILARTAKRLRAAK